MSEQMENVAEGREVDQPYTVVVGVSATSKSPRALAWGAAQAAQNDATVRPYRSFLNLSEGKILCIMEAASKEALANWFEKMHMPCDYITSVELEGYRGEVKEA